MINWDDPDERYYQHGLDHGVLYIKNQLPLPWNGLINLDENNDGANVELSYRDGVVYLADADPGDFTAKITAIMYPDEFGVCIGIPEATDGLFVDGQKPQPFGLSYRSLVGSGTRGDLFGYQIHLVYNCTATINSRQRRTIGKDTAPLEFGFDVVCAPKKLPGFRPTAHYVVDTRGMSPSIVTTIENILYGVGATPGRLPEPLELYELMNFGNNITVTSYSNGTFKVDGSSANVKMTDNDHFQLSNINSTAPDVNGQYIISTGGTTTVVTG